MILHSSIVAMVDAYPRIWSVIVMTCAEMVVMKQTVTVCTQNLNRSKHGGGQYSTSVLLDVSLQNWKVDPYRYQFFK